MKIRNELAEGQSENLYCIVIDYGERHGVNTPPRPPPVRVFSCIEKCLAHQHQSDSSITDVFVYLMDRNTRKKRRFLSNKVTKIFFLCMRTDNAVARSHPPKGQFRKTPGCANILNHSLNMCSLGVCVTDLFQSVT